MTDPIAIYGAVTGTVGAIGAGWAFWHGAVRDRARIRAELRFGFLKNYPQVPPNEPLYFIEVMNHGRRMLVFSSLPGLEFKGGRKLVFTGSLGPPGPTALGECAMASFYAPESALAKELRGMDGLPVRILIKDDAGREYRRRIGNDFLRMMQRLQEQEEEVVTQP